MDKNRRKPTDTESLLASALLKFRGESGSQSTPLSAEQAIVPAASNESTVFTDDSEREGELSDKNENREVRDARTWMSAVPDSHTPAVVAAKSSVLDKHNQTKGKEAPSRSMISTDKAGSTANCALVPTKKEQQQQQRLAPPRFLFSPKETAASNGIALLHPAHFFVERVTAASPVTRCEAPLVRTSSGTQSNTNTTSRTKTNSPLTQQEQEQQVKELPPGSRNGGWASSSASGGTSSSSNVTTVSASAVTAALEESPIRREEVEAALRSKPQRGRKRDNLSELERMELTRTRNREHAKSTRMRKKARYQELLECEEELQTVRHMESLVRQRKQNVVRFFHVRERILRREFRMPPVGVTNAAAAGGARDSAAAASSSQQPHHTPTSSIEVASSLSDTVHDTATFVFDNNSSGENNNEEHQHYHHHHHHHHHHNGFGPAATSSNSRGIERMVEFDDTMSARVIRHFGPVALSFLSYHVCGGINGVALNESNAGFVDMDILLTTAPSANIPLVSAIVRILFVPDSAKICGIRWNTTRDLLQQHADAARKEAKLPAQVSFPSIVSLDPAALGQETTSTPGLVLPSSAENSPGNQKDRSL